MNEGRARKPQYRLSLQQDKRSFYKHFTKSLAVENLKCSSEKASLQPLGSSDLNKNGLEKQYYFALLFDPHHSRQI